MSTDCPEFKRTKVVYKSEYGAMVVRSYKGLSLLSLPDLLDPCTVIYPLLCSILGNLGHGASSQLLRDDSGEESKPEVAKDHQPPRQHTDVSMATNLLLVASSALLKGHLLPPKSPSQLSC